MSGRALRISPKGELHLVAAARVLTGNNNGTERAATRADDGVLQVLGQDLVGITMMLHACRQRTLCPATAVALLDIERRLRGAVRHVDGIHQGLYRPGEHGPRGPLRRLAEQVRRDAGVDCALVLQGRLASIPGHTVRVIVDVAQEAIGNALRHAQCRRITVCCSLQSQQLLLEVLDDGNGLQPEDLRRGGGSGVTWMTMRAVDGGGRLRILPGVPRGTRVCLQLGSVRKS